VVAKAGKGGKKPTIRLLGTKKRNVAKQKTRSSFTREKKKLWVSDWGVCGSPNKKEKKKGEGK